jgi:glutaconate CoA-transferase subunit B
MIVEASRHIQNKQRIFVGLGQPVLACILAQRIRAPDITMIFESGVIGARPSRLVLTMGDPALASGSAMVTDIFDLFALTLQHGLVDVGFLGGAQIDKFGNLNTSVIGEYYHPKVRLPGSGGGCEVASLSRETVIIIAHEKRRFLEKVDFITSPGHVQDGLRSGIRGHGPSKVITTLGICKFDQNGEMLLDSVHPGVTVERVLENTGWPLKVAPEVKVTNPPSKEELKVLREEIDPKGIFLRKRVE